MTPQRLLIIGSNSYTGLYLCESLKERFDLIGVDIQKQSIFSGPINYICSEDKSNLSDQLENVASPTAIVYLSALSGVSVCDDNPQLAINVNINRPLLLLRELCHKFPSKPSIVFFSTAEIDYLLSSEKTNLSTYLLTKLLSEIGILTMCSEDQIGCTILRPNTLAAANYYPKGRLLSNIYESVIHRKELTLNNPNQAIKLTSLESITNVILDSIENPQYAQRVVSFLSDPELTHGEISIYFSDPTKSLEHNQTINEEKQFIHKQIKTNVKYLQSAYITRLEEVLPRYLEC